jgi:hypothetical protein
MINYPNKILSFLKEDLMTKTPTKPKKSHADVQKFNKGKVEHVKVGEGEHGAHDPGAWLALVHPRERRCQVEII